MSFCFSFYYIYFFNNFNLVVTLVTTLMVTGLSILCSNSTLAIIHHHSISFDQHQTPRTHFYMMHHHNPDAHDLWICLLGLDISAFCTPQHYFMYAHFLVFFISFVFSNKKNVLGLLLHLTSCLLFKHPNPFLFIFSLHFLYFIYLFIFI